MRRPGECLWEARSSFANGALQPIFNSPVGVLFGIANVGNARVKGVEGDALWRPISGLDVRMGIGAIDAKITKSIVAGVATGSELPDAPKLTLNGMVKYKWKLDDQVSADVTLSGNYQRRSPVWR